MSGIKYTDLLNNVNTYNSETTGDLVTSAGVVGLTVPSYEQVFTQYYDKIKKNAEDTYNQQIANAEIQRQKEVIAAANAYNSSTAQSGANAAALGSMGLAGSGYSKYLDSQAYAQKQGAINSAYQNKQSAINQAEAAKNSAVLTAEGVFLDYLQQAESNKQVAYQNIYDNLPSLSFSDIERLGTARGLDETTIKSLKEARNELTYASLLGSEYGQKTLDDLVGTGHLSTDSPEYNNLKNDMIKIDASDIPDMFKDLSYDASKATLEKLKPLIDDATYTALKKQFDVDFGVTRANVTLKKGTLLEKNTGKSGRAISVKDSSDNKYTVTYSGTALSGELKKAADANNINNNEVFKLRGNLYIKIDGEYYKLSNASLTNENDYENLKNLFA